MKNKFSIIIIALLISIQMPVFSLVINNDNGYRNNTINGNNSNSTNIYNEVNVCANYDRNVSLSDLGISAIDYNNMSLNDRHRVKYLINNLKVNNSRVIDKAKCRSNISMSDLGITAQEYLDMSASDRSRINNLIQELKN